MELQLQLMGGQETEMHAGQRSQLQADLTEARTLLKLVSRQSSERLERLTAEKEAELSTALSRLADAHRYISRDGPPPVQFGLALFKFGMYLKLFVMTSWVLSPPAMDAACFWMSSRCFCSVRQHSDAVPQRPCHASICILFSCFVTFRYS